MPFIVIVLYFVDLVACACFLKLVNKILKHDGPSYPAGPKPLPIVGNLMNVPKEAAWRTYAEWAKTHGDIMSVQILGKVIVILQSAKAAHELLDKRASIYSDRPPFPFIEMMKWDSFLVTAPYNEGWRARHKILARALRPRSIVASQAARQIIIHDFLKALRLEPAKFRHHIDYLQSSIIMSLVYGYDIGRQNDKYLSTAIAANVLVQKVLLPGAHLVNDLPFLKYLPGWLPGIGFKEVVRVGTRLGDEMVNAPFELVKENMENGTARPSVTCDELGQLGQLGTVTKQAERAIADAAGSLYLAGTDTTTSSMASIILALALYPSVQSRAQAELDSITGGTRLPEYEDRPRLPYIDAICNEVQRWAVVVPLGVPHATMEDDIYDGYLIPKGMSRVLFARLDTGVLISVVSGATVISNIWAILHDPTTYPEPDAFKPERFLTENGLLKADPALSAVFGFGKRICPGRHLVDSTLFMFTAAFLSAFNICNAKDEKGVDIPVECAYTTDAMLSHPGDFKCSILPRNQTTENLIMATSWND